MLITPDELSRFSGKYPDNELLQNKYIKVVQELIIAYVGYDPETREEWKQHRIVSVFVYSEDGDAFYEDEGMTVNAEIPQGVHPEPTLIENQYVYDVTEDYYDIPSVFSMVALEIATLLQQEEEQNLGINSKSFGESGSRTFLNVVNYDKYLARLGRYRKARIY